MGGRAAASDARGADIPREELSSVTLSLKRWTLDFGSSGRRKEGTSTNGQDRRGRSQPGPIVSPPHQREGGQSSEATAQKDRKNTSKKKVRTDTATVCGLECLSQVGRLAPSITRLQKATYPDHRRPSMLMNGGSITSFTSLFFSHRFYRLSRGIYRLSGTCFSFVSFLFRALVQYTPLLLYPSPDPFVGHATRPVLVRRYLCDPTSVNKSVLFLNQA